MHGTRTPPSSSVPLWPLNGPGDPACHSRFPFCSMREGGFNHGPLSLVKMTSVSLARPVLSKVFITSPTDQSMVWITSPYSPVRDLPRNRSAVRTGMCGML